MPKFTVMMNALVNFTIVVEVEDADQAYDAAKDVVYSVLDGSNVDADFRAIELVDKELVDDQAEANEQECQEALEEAGWRRATPEELAAGFQPFQHRHTGSRTASSWADLAEQLLSEA